MSKLQYVEACDLLDDLSDLNRQHKETLKAFGGKCLISKEYRKLLKKEIKIRKKQLYLLRCTQRRKDRN